VRVLRDELLVADADESARAPPTKKRATILVDEEDLNNNVPSVPITSTTVTNVDKPYEFITSIPASRRINLPARTVDSRADVDTMMETATDSRIDSLSLILSRFYHIDVSLCENIRDIKYDRFKISFKRCPIPECINEEEEREEHPCTMILKRVGLFAECRIGGRVIKDGPIDLLAELEDFNKVYGTQATGDGPAELSSYQKVINAIQLKINENKYKKYNTYVMQQAKDKQGKLLNNWIHLFKEDRMAMTIKDLIIDIIHKDVKIKSLVTRQKGFDSWVKDLTAYFQTNPDFPTLHKNRKVFGFKDGIYVLYACDYNIDGSVIRDSESSFPVYFNEDGTLPSDYADEVPRHYFDETIARNMEGTINISYIERKLDANGILEKYPTETFLYIHCKEIFCVFWDQNYKNSVGEIYPDRDKYAIIVWSFAFIGRLLYEVNELDNWHIAFSINGRAKTGKGVVIQTVEHWFDIADRGHVSVDSKKEYIVNKILDAMIMYTTDHSGTLPFDYDTYKKMIVGEPVEARAIFGAPKDIPAWRIPSLFVGQFKIHYPNDGGALERRNADVTFTTKINRKDVNVKLLEQSKKRAGTFAILCNKIYLATRQYVGDNDIHTKLHPYFEDQNQQLGEINDKFYMFISEAIGANGTLVIDPKISTTRYNSDYYITSARLKELYGQSIGEINPKWNEVSVWATVLDEFDLVYKKTSRLNPNRQANPKEFNGIIWFGIAEASNLPFIESKQRERDGLAKLCLCGLEMKRGIASSTKDSIDKHGVNHKGWTYEVCTAKNTPQCIWNWLNPPLNPTNEQPAPAVTGDNDNTPPRINYAQRDMERLHKEKEKNNNNKKSNNSKSKSKAKQTKGKKLNKNQRSMTDFLRQNTSDDDETLAGILQ